MVSKKHLLSICFFIGLSLSWGEQIEKNKRGSIRGLIVPNDSILVDGYTDDWEAFGEKLNLSKTTSGVEEFRLRKQMTYKHAISDGNADLSFDIYTAVDDQNFYVLGRIRDQFIFNQGHKIKKLYTGDNIEIFIDSNPIEKRFAEKHNENSSQFILVPSYTAYDKHDYELHYLVAHKGAVAPRIDFANRYHSWGYTFEVRIPKKIHPHWPDHNSTESIGFGVEVHDADNAGITKDGGSLFAVRWLKSPHSHHFKPTFLSSLQFDLDVRKQEMVPVKSIPKMNQADLLRAIRQATEEDADQIAQQLYDHMTEARYSFAVNAAARSSLKTIQQAGIFILARNSMMKLEPDTRVHLLKILKAPIEKCKLFRVNKKTLSYAMLALANRKRLPVELLSPAYIRAYDTRKNDHSLRMNFMWAAHLDEGGDFKELLGYLLYDGDLVVRRMAAYMIGEYRLTKFERDLLLMQENDPSISTRKHATAALEKLHKN